MACALALHSLQPPRAMERANHGMLKGCRRASQDASRKPSASAALAEAAAPATVDQGGPASHLRKSTTGGPLALDKSPDWVLAACGVGVAQCANRDEMGPADEPWLRAGCRLACRRGGNRARGQLVPL